MKLFKKYVIRKANKYIDLSMPWILAKQENSERLNAVLYNLVETIRIIGIALRPFLVETPSEIFNQIGVEDDICTWDSSKKFGLLKENTKVKKGKNLFQRIEINKEKPKMEQDKKDNEVVQEVQNQYITIDDLSKVELKVGQVLEVSRVENSDKLYKLIVDIGNEKRTIVSGIVPYYKEEELLNKQIVVVTNLKPAKLRGIESQGMLLAAGDNDVVKLLVLDNNQGTLENGTNIH